MARRASIAQLIEVAVRGHHTRGHEARPAPQAVPNATDDVGVGLLREVLECGYARLDLSSHLPGRLGLGILATIAAACA